MKIKCLMLFVGFFACCAFSEEVDLTHYEKTLYSQNGEDGIISKLVHLVQPKHRFLVDFGAYDGVTGSNSYLLRKQGWQSLLMDRGYDIPEHGIHREFITKDNINQLFHKYNVPEHFGLLSVDVDYNDFYIWQAIDSKYRADIIVMEYNASIPPQEDKIVKYRPYYLGDGTNYFGASILAMYRLGRSKGYSLVYADRTGTNLFFLRDELVANLEEQGIFFKSINDVAKLYHRPTYGLNRHGGHLDDTQHRSYFSSSDFLVP